MSKLKEKLQGPIAWMVSNHVAANLLMMLFLVGGGVVFMHVQREFLPDTADDTVTVAVSYPGASPEEVEQGILLAVEEEVRGIEGIIEMTSSANEGRASTRLRLDPSADHMKIYQDIKSSVDRITTLPEEAEEPEVSLNVRRIDVLELMLYGDSPDTSLRELSERIRERLLNDPRISQVELKGVRDLEIGISVSLANLRRYNLTPDQLAAKLRDAAIELPGGGIKSEDGEILLRVTERRDFGHEFAELPILMDSNGTRVTLADIAVVDDGLEDSDRYALYNGKPAVSIEVFRVGKETPQSVSEAALELVEIMKPELPAGIDISVLKNKADTYEERADLMMENGIMGLILVLLFLGLFLELRLAFWVMMGIPISFLGAVLLMPVFGVSLNMITMFAFILALGIVVDDAIVVGENIYTRHQNGESFKEAAIKGTREVASPVGFSILTNMVAFLPICVLPGMMGKMWGMLPIIVISAFFVSWLESLYILPCHLAHHKERKRRGLSRLFHSWQQKFSYWFLYQVKTKYGRFIDWALGWRYPIVLTAGAIFAITMAYIASGQLGYQTFPRIESDFGYGYAQLPFGSPVEKTQEVYEIMEKAAQEVIEASGHPELYQGTFALVGGNGSHTLDMFVFLAPPEVRDKIMSTQEFVNRWREKIGRLSGVDILQLQSNRGGPGSGASLTLELRHSEMEVLEQASQAVAAELQNFAHMVKDIDSGFQPGKRQLDFQVTDAARSLGLDASQIARQIRSYYYGAEVLRQQRGRNEIKVKVRLPLEERETLFSLSELIIRNNQGQEIPLKEAVNINAGRAYTSINRRDGFRTVTVSANVEPRSRNLEMVNVLDADIMPRVMEQFPGLTYAYEGSQADDRDTFGKLAVMIPLVILAIYGLLAIPFRSYLQPLIVMTSIPLGIVGAVIGHLLMGYSMSIVGIIGILALSGVVVNDALVLIDFANNRRKEGDSAHDAVVAAGVQRFRPILLTTITTFGGLMPMIFETSRQARFLIPMALSLGFGILFATLITLVLVPSLYMIVEDFKKFIAWLFAKN